MIASFVVAVSDNEVIGAGGRLPWHIPEDMLRFRRLTTGHVVVMGRLTHESIVARLGHPLPGRTSIVVSHTAAGHDGHDGSGVRAAGSVVGALSLARELAAAAGDEEFFIAGGVSVYRQTLAVTDRIYLTRVHQTVAGDRAMPAGWLDGFTLVSRAEGVSAAGTGYEWLGYDRSPA